MRDYKQGKIYTIRCKYDDSLIYVGSTVERLCVRMARHRASSKRYECMDYRLYQEVNKTNWDDWFIELYEDCPCESKEQLNKREGQIIREIATLNKRVAGRTKQEYYLENAARLNENKKQYRRENAERIKEISKEYYRDNCEKIIEKNKQYNRENADKIQEYRLENADKIQEYNKEYRRENAARLNERQNEKINCECGAIITRCGFARHKRSDKHAKKMEKMIDT
jgi:hypothetical protein